MKGWIIILILLLVIGGTCCAIYFIKEKPIKEESQEIYNISLSAIDSFSGDLISTNYAVYVGGKLDKTGRTSDSGYVLLRYPKNSSVFIESTNLTYYNDKVEAVSNDENLTRVTLQLNRLGQLNISPLNPMFDWDNIITFNLTTDYYFKNLILCTEWSYAVIFVKSNYSEMPEPLNTFDRCWNTGISIDRTTPQNITLTYKLMNSFKEGDYIKIYFIDSENDITGINESKDYWAPNKNYTLEGVPPETFYVPITK